MTKPKISIFQPLMHQDINIKQELLTMARKAANENGEDGLSSRLASVLIYSNIAEYLAQNLLDNLTYYAKMGTYNYYGGIMFVEKISSREKNLTLGSIICEIEKFSFPDKQAIVECFKKISESRNRIFHNFAKSDLDTIVEMVNDDLPSIMAKCEEVINKVDTIYVGLGKVLQPAIGK